MSSLFLLALGATIRATLLLLGAAGMAVLLRKRTAALQHALWTAAMAASLSIPLLSLALPSLGVSNPVPVGQLVSAAWTRIESAGFRSPGSDARTTSMTAPADARSARSSFDVDAIFTSAPSEGRSASRITLAVLAVWIGGLAVFLLKILRSSLAVIRLRRSGTEISDERITFIWRQLQRSSPSRNVLLVEADGVAAPGTAGIIRPTIFLPRDAAEWGSVRIRATLAHEYAHVLRRDCLTHLLADIAVAVYWFNPTVWYARRRMTVERERACDDLVLRDGVRPERYASVLVETVRGSLLQRNVRVSGVLSMARPSELETRLLSILDPSQSRGRASSRATILTGSIVTAAAVLISVSHLDAATISAASNRATTIDSHVPSSAIIAESAPARLPELRTESAPSTGLLPLPNTGPKSVAQVESLPDRPLESAAQVPSLRDSQKEPDVRGDSIAGPLSERVVLSEAIWSAARNTAALNGPDSVLARVLYAQLSRSPKWEGDLVRDRSAWALSRQRGAAGVLIDPLIESLSDRAWRIRAYAAWALGESGASRAVPALVALLRDPNWRVRAMASYALDATGDPRATTAMAGAAQDEAWQVRVNAVHFIGALQDPKYLSLLQTALGDRHMTVRAAASEALDNSPSHR